MCIAAAFVLLPSGLGQPGLPITLRADEASWYLAALSLAHDGDLRVEERDLERLFEEYAYAQELELRLVGQDGWSRVAVDVPALYPLLGAPFVRLLASDGLRMLHAALFVLLVACAARLLLPRRDAPSGAGVATVLAAAFLATSAVALHVFWLRPTLVAAALAGVALALRPPRPEAAAHETDDALDDSITTALISGLALGLAGGLEPWTLVLGPALLAVRGRRATWLGGLAVALLAALAVHQASAPPTDAEHAVFRVSAPSERPWLDADAAPLDEGPGVLGRRAEHGALDLVYALIERRTGLLPYFPWLLVLLPGLLRPAARRRWRSAPFVFLALGLVVAVFARPFVPSPVDGALPGDPRLVALAPAWLALVGGVGLPSLAASLVGVLLGALLLTPALFTPFLAPVPDAATHHYARGLLWRHLPLDPGHVGRARLFIAEDVGPGTESWRLWRPGGQTSMRTDQVWTLGGERVELYLDLPRSIDSGLFQVGSYAAPNQLTLRAGRARHRLSIDEAPATGWFTLLALEPGDGRMLHGEDGSERVVYRLVLRSARGAKPVWRELVPNSDYVGGTLAYFGSSRHLERDVYGVEWLGCGLPPRLARGEETLALGRVRNTSPEPWNHRGAVRVRLAHRWHDAGSNTATDGIAADGRRADLPAPLAPGDDVVAWLPLRAPDRPGRYTVVFEPLYENVAWFSDRAPPAAVTCRADVLVVD